jgi:hypothetical protein
MGFSDRILGKTKTVPNGRPHIAAITPAAALPGGEVRISGRGLKPPELARPTVRFGEEPGAIVVSSDEFIVARVPEEATSGLVTVSSNGHPSAPFEMKVAVLIAENVHPVTNPAFDPQGNLYVTLSGTRGQKTPVSVYKIDTGLAVHPFLSDVMNATGLAFDRTGQMFVSSRHEGTVYRVAPNGTKTLFASGLGVATGIAFDRAGDLYVGDRSGTIFKISRTGETFVFATLEPSVCAYHLAFAASGDLYVSGPTTSSYDSVYAINPNGEVREFFRGLGRPQGMAFDRAGNLYLAASYQGKRGIVQITPQGTASLAVAGYNLVGLAFAPDHALVVATTSAVHHLSLGIEGMPLHG